MAYTLIGGTAVGTVLTLLFLPALYAIWFKVAPDAGSEDEPAVPAIEGTEGGLGADFVRQTS